MVSAGSNLTGFIVCSAAAAGSAMQSCKGGGGGGGLPLESRKQFKDGRPQECWPNCRRSSRLCGGNREAFNRKQSRLVNTDQTGTT